MKYRITLALDEWCIARMRKLSTLWQISQAEVISRCLEMAEQSHSQGKEITHRIHSVALLRERIQQRSLDVDSWIQTARNSRC